MSKYMEYAKFVVAALTAALMAVASMLPVDSPDAKVISVILAVLGAIAVYVVPNKAKRKATKN
jgi:hypothetical protein